MSCTKKKEQKDVRIRAVPWEGKEAYAWKKKGESRMMDPEKETGFAPFFTWFLQKK